MGKFALFSTKAQEAFGSEKTYMNFNKLLVDRVADKQAVSKTDADEKIREKFSAVLGLTEKSTKKEIRRAIQHNQRMLFDIIEDVLEELVATGWADNEWFYKYAEIKNTAAGDENEFYIEDDSVLTVSEFSGNHHDLQRQKLGAGTSFPIKTSWYGVRLLSSLAV